MPYIQEKRRQNLDKEINQLVVSLKTNLENVDNPFGKSLDNNELMQLLGDLNYCVSRLISSLMGDVSYTKIAMITGVLENIKQEYYRRVGQNYEDKKILENGDIKEYKKLN